ncbi:hypothetical protein J4526_01515 [Desulfurococcaceae archaeon MEX13E-LK6-19]|nr:hypothetical protein J4526_01515 [Desulfurococcaceae archaeon MEX13E-LK6-19]
MVGFLRFNGKSIDPAEVLDKSLDAVTTVANDLSAKIDTLRDDVEAKIAGLRTRVDYLQKIVENNLGKPSWIDSIAVFIYKNNPNVRYYVAKIKELQQATKTLKNNGHKDMAARLQDEIDRLHAALRKEILQALVLVIEEKLLEE